MGFWRGTGPRLDRVGGLVCYHRATTLRRLGRVEQFRCGTQQKERRRAVEGDEPVARYRRLWLSPTGSLTAIVCDSAKKSRHARTLVTTSPQRPRQALRCQPLSPARKKLCPELCPRRSGEHPHASQQPAKNTRHSNEKALAGQGLFPVWGVSKSAPPCAGGGSSPSRATQQCNQMVNTLSPKLAKCSITIG